MKLSELLKGGQFNVRQIIEDETREWEHSSIWWRGQNKRGEAVENMRRWFAAFNVFKDNVLNKDMDIEDAFRIWAKIEGPIMSKHMNVPQLQFWERYHTARFDKQRQLEEAANVQT
jgi:hypothetical protein